MTTRFAMACEKLTQQLRNQSHRHEQPPWLGLQGKKPVVPIESCSGFVLRVDHNRHRGNLVGMRQAAVQRIEEQVFPEALTLGAMIDGQPAQQGDG